MPEEKDYHPNPNSVGFTCRNTKESIAFYRDKLGFTLRECWPDTDNPMWASLVLDDQSVMLGQAMDPEKVSEMCANDPAEAAIHKRHAEEFRDHKPGVGIHTYIKVPNIDAYHDQVVSAGVKNVRPPKSQFYGLRDIYVSDPDGYQLVFYTPIQMKECQSCGMPLQDAQPGQMYCQYCTDEKGKLKPYEQILEGTISGYFMGMKKMSRPDAEKAAKEHLAKMPAWAGRG